MSNYRVAFFIDKMEFKYFSFNQLITSFWLIKECNARNWEVYIGTADKMYLKNNIAIANLYKTKLIGSGNKVELVREKNSEVINLNDLDIIFFRPDPPIDIDYIYCTHILDFVDQTTTLVVNNPTGIRKANEKLYINEFQEAAPDNITASDPAIIKAFLDQYKTIVIKPLDKCFGKGVFYLEYNDKNRNTIIDTATSNGKNFIMAQQYLRSEQSGDKRINIIGGEVYKEAVIKVSGEGDFKFNSQQDKYFLKGELTPEEMEICTRMIPKLIADGLYLAGLDVINNKIIEINVTSPCFFIKEINKLFDIQLEVRIINSIEGIASEKIRKKQIAL